MPDLHGTPAIAPTKMACASARMGIRSVELYALLDMAADPTRHPPGPECIRGIFSMLGGSFDGKLNYLSPQAVQKKTLEHTKRIFENWSWLRDVIPRHEDVVQRRWLKKSPNKRGTLLTHVWPDIPTGHRPDLYAIMEIMANVRGAGHAARREVYLWPHLNLEDLVKPEPLLLMLNARGRNYPDAFVNSDFDACRIGLSDLQLVPANPVPSSLCMQCFYGQLSYCLHDEGRCRDRKLCAEGVVPGLGLLLLDIQDWLYHFLVQCSRAILHDIPQNDIIAANFPVRPEPPSVSATCRADILDAFSIAVQEAPYRLPADFNLNRLEAVVSARLAAAKDHVFALREDPGYFAHTILGCKEHNNANVLDLAGNPHASLLQGDAHMWDHEIHRSIGEALEAVVMWHTLLQQIVAFRSRVAKKPAYHCDNCFWSDTLDAFVELDKDLDRFLKELMQRTYDGFYSSPIMRSTQCCIDGSDPEHFSLHYRKPYQPGTVMSKLQFIHNVLYTKVPIGSLDLGRKVFLDELDLFLKKQPEARQKFTSWTLSHLAYVYLLSDCAEQLRLYLVSESCDDSLIAKKVAASETDEYQRHPLLASLKNCHWCHGLSSFGKPSKNQVQYPADKPHNKRNTDIKMQAKKRLDYLWDDLRRSLKKNVESSPLLGDLLSQNGLVRTESWVEPLCSKKKDRLAAQVSFEPAYLLPHTAPVANARSEILLPSRGKVKTRGTPISQSFDAAGSMIEEEQTDAPRQVFKVKDRALRVFKTLFHDDSGEASPGEIPWTDFCFAMASMGFAHGKLFGSFWNFHPTDEKAHRSIQFHEPHPVAKLPYITAKRFGRRLNRAFGWTANMFTLA
ncbi:Uu.00g079930.m01.CDS01 [Anthostomella pinea]|uniref:Uu.00g079930.m01.CDS01 n=1 Tax=Anthostomella pinea TaxID=933095 RepID=A0AAI8VLK3_9PEZI|nr:Uu.00g079930.m01.CDS01 [Anthostomella pinea]